MAPISSRKIDPRCQRELAFFELDASVNALSRAEQFRLEQRPGMAAVHLDERLARCALQAWTARHQLLPVPVPPVINTVRARAATSSSRWIVPIARLRPTMPCR
jgi:hypothetical protein